VLRHAAHCRIFLSLRPLRSFSLAEFPRSSSSYPWLAYVTLPLGPQGNRKEIREILEASHDVTLIAVGSCSDLASTTKPGGAADDVFLNSRPPATESV
jgi:hypothetical protein